MSEAATKQCRFCGSPFHRGWQCKENPKVIAKLEARRTTKNTFQLSPRTSKQRRKATVRQSRTKLIKKYDILFSQYIRKKAELERNLFCFTCGKKLTYDTAVAMHFINRRFVSTRFDEDNVHIGCLKCNTPDKDQPDVLRRYATLLGQDVVERLNAQKYNRISTPELQANYEQLKEKYKSLLL